jgi:hypothetical protein
MTAAPVSCWPRDREESPAPRGVRGFLLGLKMKKLLLLLCYLPLTAHAFDFGKPNWGKSEFEDDEKPWAELEAQLPPAPKPENFLPFFVSATTDNRFYIDAPSITPGKDGVVRYTLIIKSSAGAVNISYEGIRCDPSEVKRYAFGRADGSWAKARSAKWEAISYKDVNRQHHMLHDDFFCPNNIPVLSREAAIKLLQAGAHLSAGGAAW